MARRPPGSLQAAQASSPRTAVDSWPRPVWIRGPRLCLLELGRDSAFDRAAGPQVDLTPRLGPMTESS